MARAGRKNDWGFPRWGGYGSERAAKSVRMCDRHGCDRPGDCPAPKSPNSAERWYFCQEHAAEYNKGWDYFAGLDEEERTKREQDEARDASGFKGSSFFGWGAAGDGTRSRDEMRALEILECDTDADFETVRKAWRRLAKANHPDVCPNDKEAALRFQAIQAAYDVVKAAEDRRNWKPGPGEF